MMKKIFTVSFSLLLILASAYAQLNIKSTNSISERFYKDTWATVTWNGSAFLFNSSDPTTSLTLTFTLDKSMEALNALSDPKYMGAAPEPVQGSTRQSNCCQHDICSEITMSENITERLCAIGRAFIDACRKVDCFNGKKRFENLHSIMETLPHIRTNEQIYTYEARMPMMEGKGDRSYPYARRNDRPFNSHDIGSASEMFYKEDAMRCEGMYPIRESVSYDFCEESVWEMYLIEEMFRFLPLYWHGVYYERIFILSQKDIDALVKNHFVRTPEDTLSCPIADGSSSRLLKYKDDTSLLPAVKILSENSARLTLSQWDEWSGLDRLTITAHDTGKGIIFDVTERKNLFRYDCGFLF